MINVVIVEYQPDHWTLTASLGINHTDLTPTECKGIICQLARDHGGAVVKALGHCGAREVNHYDGFGRWDTRPIYEGGVYAPSCPQEETAR